MRCPLLGDGFSIALNNFCCFPPLGPPFSFLTPRTLLTSNHTSFYLGIWFPPTSMTSGMKFAITLIALIWASFVISNPLIERSDDHIGNEAGVAVAPDSNRVTNQRTWLTTRTFSSHHWSFFWTAFQVFDLKSDSSCESLPSAIYGRVYAGFTCEFYPKGCQDKSGTIKGTGSRYLRFQQAVMAYQCRSATPDDNLDAGDKLLQERPPNTPDVESRD